MDSKKLLRNLANKSNILIPHIDRYQAKGIFPDEWHIVILNKKQEREYGEATIRFSPNSDALLSALALYKKHTEEVAEDDFIGASLRRTFDVGSFWHGYLQAILLDMNFIDEDGIEKYIIKKIESQEGSAFTSGMGDLVGVKIPGNGEWLVDIKTMSSGQFKSPAKYLMEKYTAQVNIYSDMFNIDNIMILAVNKDGPHDMKEIIVKKDQKLIDDIYSKWIFVSECIKKGIEPEE